MHLPVTLWCKGWRGGCLAVTLGVLLALTTPAAPPAGASRHPAAPARVRPFPGGHDTWFWEIDPPAAGLAGLPPVRAPYPEPGSARIWDTDLFEDSNTSRGETLGIPTGPSPVVRALHAAGHYAVCYVTVGAYELGFPDDHDFLPADYGNRARRYQMQGYPNEWWLDIAGFRSYRPGVASSLHGAAVNIAAGMEKRFHWCALEGQDAVEADDITGYENDGVTGVSGGGWHLTHADELGFERWLAFSAHADGLAILQKNDPEDAGVDAPLFDGALSEQCNHYQDPCAGPGGDWDAYLALGKPVLNAEYVGDGETTASFCPADRRFGIWGALFTRALAGPTPYAVCWNRAGKL